MTDQKTPETSPTTLTSETVATYLGKNPDFFITHSDLLLSLSIPHESGRAISLVEHQLNKIRIYNQELQQQLSLLVETARENDRLFEKTRHLILDLLDANSLDGLIATLEDNLRHHFQVENISFILLSNTLKETSVRLIKPEEAQEKLGPIFSSSEIITGRFKEPLLTFLFHNTQVKSAAIAPLSNTHPLAILALGSSIPGHYKKGMGTLFLQQISDILSRLLPRFL